MNARGAWFDDVEPITARIPAGAAQHRVSWRHGRLVLHDHADLDAEAVLLALGGEPCPCLLVRDAFRGAAEEPSPHFAPNRLRVAQPGGLNIWRANVGWTRYQRPVAVLGQQPSAAARMLRSLQADPNFLKLPSHERDRVLSGLRQRAVMETVPEAMATLLGRISQLRLARRAQRQLPMPLKQTPEDRLRFAALPWMVTSMRAARANLRPYAQLIAECSRQAPGQPRQLEGLLSTEGGLLRLSLPLQWLNRVLQRGLACVDGHLVLSVDAPAPARQLQAEVVRWERQRGGACVPVVADCLITRSPSGWHIAW